MAPLVTISRQLCEQVERLDFPSVPYVYNPLVYARAPHEAYLERWGSKTPREVLMVGMNPGPFGMAQTGVPFGDVAMVRDFLGITGEVGKPAREHSARPITGFACTRSEVSGTRLWGWARDCFGSAERFFERVFVANWCPLVFMSESGRNRTPDRLPAAERTALYRACDEALAKTADVLRPRLVVGIGGFAARRAHEALGTSAAIGCILHPSPASPAANRDWSGLVDAQLRALGFAPTPSQTAG
jgi:single-strand selective monofunctional uracil DNA glycosylase